jgi:hypothetical protein
MRTVVFAAFAAASVGCIPPSESSVVTARAAHAFHCSEDEIKIKNIAGGTWEAKGCGYSETYDCTGGATGMDEVTCTPEGTSK